MVSLEQRGPPGHIRAGLAAPPREPLPSPPGETSATRGLGFDPLLAPASPEPRGRVVP